MAYRGRARGGRAGVSPEERAVKIDVQNFVMGFELPRHIGAIAEPMGLPVEIVEEISREVFLEEIRGLRSTPCEFVGGMVTSNNKTFIPNVEPAPNLLYFYRCRPIGDYLKCDFCGAVFVWTPAQELAAQSAMRQTFGSPTEPVHFCARCFQRVQTSRNG
jgi:hypothetical protein